VLNLKTIHHHGCQICGNKLQLSDGSAYSEGHHLKPVGKPHNGPDIAGNILILCPNCHALCDLGGIELNRSILRELEDHTIAQEYLDYHNKEIVKHQTSQ
jgi:predicted restriction endonuclease